MPDGNVKWTQNMATDDELLFKGTCTVFELKTCNDEGVIGELFIDPCSCYNYYRCINYKMLHQTCAEGTAWDYETKGCKHSEDVIFKQNCSEKSNVWTRCNVTETRLDELKLFCTNEPTTVPTTPTTKPTTSSGARTTDKINPGIIVGSIIGGAVIAVILLIVAFCIYKRRKINSINKKRSGTIAHNPEYFEGGQPDDPYAIINDDHVITNVRMTDPTYNGSAHGGTMSQPNGTFNNAGFDDMGEDAVYDNSGAPIVGPGHEPGGYTSTIRRSVREYETPAGAHGSRGDLQYGESWSHLTASQSDERKGGNLYVDVNGNKNKSSRHSEHGGNGIPSSVTESGSENTKGHDNENSPDYFILEANDDHM